MSNQDFDFSPPPPRRERKEFEPPPWERDLFDQLAKDREPETVEPLTMSSESEPESDVGESEPQTVVTPEIAHDAVAEDSGKAPQLAEAQVAAMLFELKAEEGPASDVYVKATVVSGALLLFIGIVMVIWSFVMIVVALQRPGQGFTGVFIGLTVLLFGAGFAGTGAWFVFKTLRQQGVL